MDIDIQTSKKANEIDIDDNNINKKIYKVIKRIVDIIGALVGCVILVPLTLVVWIANIVVKDNGPVFYIQKRIGKNGKTFKMYKFRSMVVNADKKLKRYLLDNPEANEEYMTYRKLTNDPRITPVGKFLRKASLDEFPQFINVLKGDMSLVGPRPYLPREKRAIGKVAYNQIIKVKPGLTGPWQVNGRSEVTLKDRINIDIEYIKKENALSDIKFLLKTILKIFNKNEGAK